jgi:hypothetical protein
VANTANVLALRLAAVPTNAQIETFSRENPGYRFERDVDGTLVVSPTGSAAGLRNRTCSPRWRVRKTAQTNLASASIRRQVSRFPMGR